MPVKVHFPSGSVKVKTEIKKLSQRHVLVTVDGEFVNAASC